MITSPQQPSVPSLAERLKAQSEQMQIQVEQSEQKLNTAKDQYLQHTEEYASGRRNPIADLLRKPQRDTDKEKRMQQMASLGLIGDAIGLMGKGYAASRGVRPRITEGATTYKALGELQRIDEIYRQDGYNYDQQMILDTLRRKEADDRAQAFKVQDAKDTFSYNRAQADAAKQAELGAQMANEKRQRDLSDLADERKYSEAQADKAYRRQVYLSGVRKPSKEERKYNPRNPLDVPKEDKGLYSTTFFGRTVPVTAEIQQDVAQYMASKGLDKAGYDRETEQWRQYDFDWSKVGRDPNLQRMVGKYMEEMRMGLRDPRGDNDSTPTGSAIVLNPINKILIPKLDNASEQDRQSILARGLTDIAKSWGGGETAREWIDYNSAVLSELGIDAVKLRELSEKMNAQKTK